MPLKSSIGCSRLRTRRLVRRGGARAQPDGHTLLYAVSSNTVNAALFDKLSFNFARDIELVAGLSRSPLVLEVNAAVAIETLAEFIAYAKVNPGKVSMASFGTGTISHVVGELFKMVAGVSTLHVPWLLPNVD